MSKRDYLFRPLAYWPSNWGNFFDIGSKFWSNEPEARFGRANVYSDDTAYTVEIYAGEAKEENFTISYDDSTEELNVDGKLPQEVSTPNQKEVVLEEWSFTMSESSFSRKFYLKGVDSQFISAKLENKTLVITLPKTKMSKVRSIPVLAAAPAAC